MGAQRSRSVWWQMWSGMRAYGVSITVIWAMCACTVLLVLAFAVPGTWFHVAFAAAAVGELLLSALTLRFLTRASVRGRFDV
jgi:hypothetical protein